VLGPGGSAHAPAILVAHVTVGRDLCRRLACPGEAVIQAIQPLRLGPGIRLRGCDGRRIRAGLVSPGRRRLAARLVARLVRRVVGHPAIVGRDLRRRDPARARAAGYRRTMCRNIRTLHNFEPPATSDEVRAAAVQYVRKVAGTAKPARDNVAAFERAVEEVATATRRLLDDLVPHGAPKDREAEATRARARAAQRYATS
jgi:hypothetical protein